MRSINDATYELKSGEEKPIEPINKAILYLTVIEMMFEVLQYNEVDQSELVDALIMLGFDPMEILYETNTIRSFQKICKAFSELHLTDEELTTFIQT
ncbi:hypothetical protein HUB98_05395 [Paenibacillus barcinonensis]|uniref:Uncharacterized protein n=1 Tax=Paenibacillus barcinonensis TaxID=198119 RepID=A0A2V4VCX7_PAEBA|nr:hypothetical protein [Paenibacillus barcinonensis]PYE51422.1 hypothetical protein DFQ00_102216 [Paenibacillus barcinonensis]QKS55818.1 hypothetical protein HUB98_05395 [Paenibacillus barcinonensis]